MISPDLVLVPLQHAGGSTSGPDAVCIRNGMGFDGQSQVANFRCPLRILCWCDHQFPGTCYIEENSWRYRTGGQRTDQVIVASLIDRQAWLSRFFLPLWPLLCQPGIRWVEVWGEVLFDSCLFKHLVRPVHGALIKKQCWRCIRIICGIDTGEPEIHKIFYDKPFMDAVGQFRLIFIHPHHAQDSAPDKRLPAGYLEGILQTYLIQPAFKLGSCPSAEPINKGVEGFSVLI